MRNVAWVENKFSATCRSFHPVRLPGRLHNLTMWWQGINGVGGSLSFYFPANEVVVQMLWLPASETSTVITQGGERCRTEIAAWFAPERNLNHSGMAFNLGSFWGLVGPCSRKLCEIFVPICFEAVVPMCSYLSPFFPISPCSYLFLLQASQFWYSAPKQDRTSMVPNSPSRCLRRKNTAQRCSEKVSMILFIAFYGIL